MNIFYLLLILLFSSSTLFDQEKSDLPIQHTLHCYGAEREYFIQYPEDIEPEKIYWLLIVVHGGGGNGRSYWLADGIKEAIENQAIDAIIVTPSFSNTDVQASRFPQLGEGEFLIRVVKELHKKFRIHDKILLSGYSRGGQFTHRFALQHPELVKACASFSAGTWTTPDGKLLIESMDMIDDPASFLNDKDNAREAPERLSGLFYDRVAKVAGSPAKEDARKLPFLIMCGSLDPRYEIAQQFAKSLQTHGYKVQTSWPETPHKGRDQYPEEFTKYSMKAVSFFLNAIND